MTLCRTSVLLPNEKIVFSGPVEERALRRRASRLIPIQVSPLKPKNRQLILTNHRLVCVKQRDRGVISVKHELLAQAPKIASAKDKHHIVAVEAKASKEFVVLTVSTSTFLNLKTAKFIYVLVWQVTNVRCS